MTIKIHKSGQILILHFECEVNEQKPSIEHVYATISRVILHQNELGIQTDG